MRAKINSGHNRHPRTKTATPAKPSQTKVRSGFQPLAGLNSSGSRQAIPHDHTTSPSATGSDIKSRLAGVVGKKRMY